jgi:pyridoxamine 5'-phosphate oxidase
MTDAAIPTTLEEALNEAIALWVSAVKNRHSPLHTPVVCTLAEAGNGAFPAPRIMVLRATNADASHFRFHTDARSPKCDQIGTGAPIALLGYDPIARVQLTVRGVARITQDDSAAEQAWQASALSSRRCYLAAFPPGTPVDQPTSGLPDDMLDRAPTLAESLGGRPNFAILQIEAEELEWLRLTSCGNKRALFRRQNGLWHGQWVTP